MLATKFTQWWKSAFGISTRISRLNNIKLKRNHVGYEIAMFKLIISFKRGKLPLLSENNV